MHNSSKFFAESWFFLCVVHLFRDSCPWLGHKCEDLDPPAHKCSLEQLSTPLLWGLKAVLIPRGRYDSYFCLSTRVNTRIHMDNKKNKLHTGDTKSWYSFLELLFLLEHHSCYQKVVSSTLMSIFRLSFTPGLVSILDKFYPRHFWMQYVRN